MEVTQPLRIVPLRAAMQVGADRVGGKARALAALASRGIGVPDGLVLTGSRAADGMPDDSPGPGSAHPCLAGPLAAGREDAARRICRYFGEAPLVVRRSPVEGPALPAPVGTVGTGATVGTVGTVGTAGTGATGGTVGTVRPTRGPRDLADALRRVWLAPCVSAAARAGRDDRPADATSGRIPVLVQRFVPAECVGLARPDSAEDGLLVTARPGPAAAHRPGIRATDRWYTRAGVAVPRSATAQALTRYQVQAVAALAAAVASVLGAHQEVQWAMAEHRLWVLRARPAR